MIGSRPRRPLVARTLVVRLFLLALVLAPVLSVTGLALADHLPPGGTFSDDDGNIHEGMIEAIFIQGVTRGCSVTPARYCPSDPVRRDQMASFIARAYDLPTASEDYFSDDDGNTHEDSINRIAEAGIALGFPDGTFRPEQLVRRDQMASFIARADTSLSPATKDYFTDDDGNVHELNINILAENAITFGCGGTFYCPADDARRDQMASILGAALGLTPHPPPPPGTPTSTTTATGTPLVNLPYHLDWWQDEGGLWADNDGQGTGFTWVDQPSSGTGHIPAKIDVVISGDGTYEVTTTGGLAFEASNSQDNALGVGIEPPDNMIDMETTILNPPLGTGSSEQAGLWFGNDEDNQLRLVIVSSSAGTTISYQMEIGGALSSATSVGIVHPSSHVKLMLAADPATGLVEASYAVDGGNPIVVDTITAPGGFFSAGGAGIDPTIGTDTFTGIFASHRDASSALTYVFDDFRVIEEADPPLPPGGVNFTRVENTVGYSPTAMVLAPDGRLYVTTFFGTIHALTFDSGGNIIDDRAINTLDGLLTLGIAVDPSSTSSDVTLWVSHSQGAGGQFDPGVANSSTVTRLTNIDLAAGTATRTDVVTGLPRAVANHAINGIRFEPDPPGPIEPRLFIALGGNTGAGAPNCVDDDPTVGGDGICDEQQGQPVWGIFGTRPEQFLSGALLTADVLNNPGGNWDCTDPVLDDLIGTAAQFNPCDVELYSTGLRNLYDFVFHTNGETYGADNGANTSGTVPTSAAPDCQGIVIYDLPTDPLDPGEQPDVLVRLVQGAHYGHPNPARDQCVFKDGTADPPYAQPGPLPDAGYVAPMANLGNRLSANGIIEYTSGVFCGSLQGDLLLASFSQTNHIIRVTLSSDGLTVVGQTSLIGGFDDPLALTQAANGTIYVGEFDQGNLNSGVVSALLPTPDCS